MQMEAPCISLFAERRYCEPEYARFRGFRVLGRRQLECRRLSYRGAIDWAFTPPSFVIGAYIPRGQRLAQPRPPEPKAFRV